LQSRGFIKSWLLTGKKVDSRYRYAVPDEVFSYTNSCCFNSCRIRALKYSSINNNCPRRKQFDFRAYFREIGFFCGADVASQTTTAETETILSFRIFERVPKYCFDPHIILLSCCTHGGSPIVQISSVVRGPSRFRVNTDIRTVRDLNIHRAVGRRDRDRACVIVVACQRISERFLQNVTVLHARRYTSSSSRVRQYVYGIPENCRLLAKNAIVLV